LLKRVTWETNLVWDAPHTNFLFNSCSFLQLLKAGPSHHPKQNFRAQLKQAFLTSLSQHRMEECC